MITDLDLRLMTVRKDGARVPRSRIATSPKTFAEAGNPWCTEKDWRQEEMRAQNPAAPGHDSARAFTQRASLSPTIAKPRRPYREQPRDLPVLPEVRLRQAQRETFEAVLRAARACEPEPMLRECAPAVAPLNRNLRVSRPEIGKFPKISRKTKSPKDDRRKHDIRTMRALRKAYVHARKYNRSEQEIKYLGLILQVEARLGV